MNIAMTIKRLKYLFPEYNFDACFNEILFHINSEIDTKMQSEMLYNEYSDQSFKIEIMSIIRTKLYEYGILTALAQSDIDCKKALEAIYNTIADQIQEIKENI